MKGHEDKVIIDKLKTKKGRGLLKRITQDAINSLKLDFEEKETLQEFLALLEEYRDEKD